MDDKYSKINSVYCNRLLIYSSLFSLAVSSESLYGATASDYDIISSRRIEFLSSISSYTLKIPIIDDSTPEQREGFRLALSNPTNGILGNNVEIEVQIIDDDSTYYLNTLTLVLLRYFCNKSSEGGVATPS